MPRPAVSKRPFRSRSAGHEGGERRLGGEAHLRGPDLQPAGELGDPGRDQPSAASGEVVGGSLLRAAQGGSHSGPAVVGDVEDPEGSHVDRLRVADLQLSATRIDAVRPGEDSQ